MDSRNLVAHPAGAKFGLATGATADAISSTVSMQRRACIFGLALLVGLALCGSARAGSLVFLSNTPVDLVDTIDRFGDGSPSAIWAEATEQAGNVRVHSVAYRGLAETSAEGFFLYSYEIESLNPGTTYVTDFLVDVPGRVAFDLDGDDGTETSAYCAALCVPNLAGAYPDQVFVETGDLVDFRFALLEHSTRLWIVSAHAPATISATVTRAFSAGDVAIDVIAPSAPEPATALAGATAALALAALRRRYRAT